ncbi:MAG: efflux RND transporter periplasmic adaptor subunit [Bacteroidota bacterium]
MRNLITFFAIAFLLAACSAPQAEPTDLAGMKKSLREKRAELKELEAAIGKLQKDIAKLDTTKKEEVRQLVTTTAVDKRNFSRFVEIQSNVQTVDAVMASSETGGRILKLNVDEGSYVKKGQLIARVDLESIDKQIEEVKKSKELAVQLYDRQKRLWDQNIGSEVQYLQAKNNVERLDKSLESLDHQLTKANVYAPISGVVNMVMIESGETAPPGGPIVEIINTSRVKVVADVPERYLRAVRKGERVKVSFPAIEEEKEARVSMIGRTIDPANRTFAVEVELSNPKGLLKPNLLAIMFINDFSEDNAVTVPVEVVQQDVSGRDFVFVAEKGTAGLFAKKVFIEVGESYEGEVIIKDGLQGGESLIVDGARGLSDREPIKI